MFNHRPHKHAATDCDVCSSTHTRKQSVSCARPHTPIHLHTQRLPGIDCSAKFNTHMHTSNCNLRTLPQSNACAHPKILLHSLLLRARSESIFATSRSNYHLNLWPPAYAPALAVNVNISWISFNITLPCSPQDTGRASMHDMLVLGSPLKVSGFARTVTW